MKVHCKHCGRVAADIGLKDEFAGLLGLNERRIVNILRLARPYPVTQSQLEEITGMSGEHIRQCIHRIRQSMDDEVIPKNKRYRCGYRWNGA